MKSRLIAALDVPTADQALELVAALRNEVGMVKVGSQLFTAAGPDIVRAIVRSDVPVFLDLKFHDIPNTVAEAAVAATRLGVRILNVHAAGGPEMMQRTADAVTKAALSEGLVRPAVIAVTVLTSSDEATLVATGIKNLPEEQVIKLALLAEQNGMDGLVASPLEVAAIRSAISRQGFLLVTPGVRPAGASYDDQKRVMSPAEAVAAGADYVVMGRSIISAKDPVAAARRIAVEMAGALGEIPTDRQELQHG